jgi:hypothetical protein
VNDGSLTERMLNEVCRIREEERTAAKLPRVAGDCERSMNRHGDVWEADKTLGKSKKENVNYDYEENKSVSTVRLNIWRDKKLPSFMRIFLKLVIKMEASFKLKVCLV